jgi:hypothetical protein
MVLVVLMSSHIIEEHEFRRAIAGIHHISSSRVGGNTDVQPADSFYLSQRSKSIQKLDQVFLGVSVFQPKDDVVNQWGSIELFHIPPARRHPRLEQAASISLRDFGRDERARCCVDTLSDTYQSLTMRTID